MKNILFVIVILSVFFCIVCIAYTDIENRLILLEIQSDNSCYEPTVYERLQEQEAMREKHYTDSIYITIPEPVLIYIFVQKGTSIPIKDVVQEYVENKKWYDNYVEKRKRN